MMKTSTFIIGVSLLLAIIFFASTCSYTDSNSVSSASYTLYQEPFEANVSEEACKCPIPGEFQLLCPNKTQCQCIRVVEKCGNPEATQCEVSRLCYESSGNNGFYHGIPVCSPGKVMCLNTPKQIIS